MRALRLFRSKRELPCFDQRAIKRSDRIFIRSKCRRLCCRMGLFLRKETQDTLDILRRGKWVQKHRRPAWCLILLLIGLKSDERKSDDLPEVEMGMNCRGRDGCRWGRCHDRRLAHISCYASLRCNFLHTSAISV